MIENASKTKTKSKTLSRLSGLLVAAAVLGVPAASSAEVATKVFLNGVATPVYFNDGDSFRVLAGPLRGSKARLAGFNTLESYGPVHQWGTWTMRELSRFASLGTLNARRGTWKCTSDMNQDSYGRVLWLCPDLAVDQVRKGLAHAMTVTSDGAALEVVKAQQEAIAARRGIWAHGVPAFVLTSLHSTSEGFDGQPYNRLVASADGHSEKWRHSDNYRECQTVCQPSEDLQTGGLPAFAAELRQDPALTAGLQAYDEATLLAMIVEFVKTGLLAGALKDEGLRVPLEARLAVAAASGRFTASQTPLSCMIYVDFRRRYGDSKASCLR